ncbi:hypothetical protein J2X20_005727 [Pelomonas saccharophila]|uniref:Uncharacterized protein n=1 Tax=Roseateles saccharophilus TaxID=304 RepID=A0ABU1YW09_ROSSA|nr:hypothetical protein [Roseateles saccharophilus]MDR7273042.1 hypothetical protein [Roseateles saccharophilus]
MSKPHLGRSHNAQSGPVQHTASEFATSKATQGQTLTKQAKPPAREPDGTAREAPKGPPQHKV